jgi:hypothetical protein
VECRHVRRASVETEIVSAVRIDLELQLRIDGQPHVGVSGVGGIVGQEIDDAERAEEPPFLWSIGDRALAANLGRTLIPVLLAPSHGINSAIGQAVRGRGRVLVSGCRARRWGSGALRARCATCSRSSGRRWATRSSSDGLRPTRTDRSTAPSPSEARRRRCRHGPRRSSAGSSAGSRPGSRPRHGLAAARGHQDCWTGTARGLIRGAKHHAGITRALEASPVRHPGLLTSREHQDGCVRGATQYIRTRLAPRS